LFHSTKEVPVSDPTFGRFAQAALTGQLSRREVLAGGLKLGLATSVITTLMAAAPEAHAAPSRSTTLNRGLAQEGSDTFTVLIIGGTEDIDPHSTYSTIGSTICYGVYDMLIRYRGDSTSEYEPMLAESWEANPENTTFTFKIKANAQFHDGTPCDAAAVKASFTRFFELGLGPADNVLKRFIDSPDRIEAVDATTVRFTTPQPEPLFLAAMASNYGPYVVRSARVRIDSSRTRSMNEWCLRSSTGITAGGTAATSRRLCCASSRKTRSGGNCWSAAKPTP
jgi:peptide/nickel transport system substrate-binding protein